METEIGRLNPSKATTLKNISPKILKDSSNIYAESLQITFNDDIEDCSFQDKLKSADVFSLHKAEAKTSKKNYRPVSVLPMVSKVLERIMDRQIIKYITPFLSISLCGFWKGFKGTNQFNKEQI